MARKFSLEAFLTLEAGGFSATVAKVKKQISGLSQGMQKIAKPILIVDRMINQVAKRVAVFTGAATVAAAALIQTTANAGDRFAKTSRMIGMTAEELQALT